MSPFDTLGYIASVIYAHPDHQVSGRVRLQKTIRLLQRVGMPTDYGFRLHFRGPYSEDLQADVAVLEALGVVNEEPIDHGYRYTASESPLLLDLGPLSAVVARMTAEDVPCLELAATYDAFRQQGADHDAALESMRHKKRKIWTRECEEKALSLLSDIGLAS